MKQGTQEWLKARSSLITGSRVGAILGMSPWMTRDAVMRSMVREAHGADSEFQSNVAVEYGNEHEPDAIHSYEAETGSIVMPLGFAVHPDYDFLGASPDGLVGQRGGLETKCPYSLRNDPEPTFKTLEEQPHYLAQVDLCIECCARDWWDFFQWTPHATSLERREKDPKWLPSVIDELAAFHREFQDIVKSKKKSAPFLETKFEERTDDEFQAVAREFAGLSSQMETLSAEREEVRQRLIELSGGKACQGFGVSVTPVTSQGRVNYSKIPQLKEIDLTPFRGKPTTTYRVTLKEKA